MTPIRTFWLPQLFHITHMRIHLRWFPSLCSRYIVYQYIYTHYSNEMPCIVLCHDQRVLFLSCKVVTLSWGSRTREVFLGVHQQDLGQILFLLCDSKIITDQHCNCNKIILVWIWVRLDTFHPLNLRINLCRVENT